LHPPPPQAATIIKLVHLHNELVPAAQKDRSESVLGFQNFPYRNELGKANEHKGKEQNYQFHSASNL